MSSLFCIFKYFNRSHWLFLTDISNGANGFLDVILWAPPPVQMSVFRNHGMVMGRITGRAAVFTGQALPLPLLSRLNILPAIGISSHQRKLTCSLSLGSSFSYTASSSLSSLLARSTSHYFSPDKVMLSLIDTGDRNKGLRLFGIFLIWIDILRN